VGRQFLLPAAAAMAGNLHAEHLLPERDRSVEIFPRLFVSFIITRDIFNNCIIKLEGKYSLESTDPGESEIRAPSLTVIYNKKFITAFLSLGFGNTS